MERDVERLAGRVRVLRRRNGFSQEALARAADVSRTTIARIELNQGNPDLLTLGKLARALGVETSELLEG